MDNWCLVIWNSTNRANANHYFVKKQFKINSIMIVLIPSYKRTEVLENVVKSVLKCDINGINERILILIVNNFPPNKEIVDEIVKKLCIQDPFQSRIIFRATKSTTSNEYRIYSG